MFYLYPCLFNSYHTSMHPVPVQANISAIVYKKEANVAVFPLSSLHKWILLTMSDLWLVPRGVMGRNVMLLQQLTVTLWDTGMETHRAFIGICVWKKNNSYFNS